MDKTIHPGQTFGALTARCPYGGRGDLWVLDCSCGDYIVREAVMLHPNMTCQCHVNGPARRSPNYTKHRLYS